MPLVSYLKITKTTVVIKDRLRIITPCETYIKIFKMVTYVFTNELLKEKLPQLSHYFIYSCYCFPINYNTNESSDFPLARTQDMIIKPSTITRLVSCKVALSFPINNFHKQNSLMN